MVMLLVIVRRVRRRLRVVICLGWVKLLVVLVVMSLVRRRLALILFGVRFVCLRRSVFRL